jgi:SAM-dependent methyltransferase
MAKSSNEELLALSEADWSLVIEANKNFTEQEQDWRGSWIWGKYLLGKLRSYKQKLDLNNSLELCCGNGFLFFCFKEIFDQADSGYFIDLSMNQCKDFFKRSENNGIKGLNILNGDIGKLPIRNNSFNLVYGHSFIHHLPDVGMYLKEIVRILKPNGKFVAFHEPNVTAPFLESFPLSLIKRLEKESLTDIWLIRPHIIEKILLEVGFSKTKIFYSGILSSFIVTPVQIFLSIIKMPYDTDFFAWLKMLCDKLDGIIPSTVRKRYSPSIAIIAEK